MVIESSISFGESNQNKKKKNLQGIVWLYSSFLLD